MSLAASCFHSSARMTTQSGLSLGWMWLAYIPHIPVTCDITTLTDCQHMRLDLSGDSSEDVQAAVSALG